MPPSHKKRPRRPDEDTVGVIVRPPPAVHALTDVPLLSSPALKRSRTGIASEDVRYETLPLWAEKWSEAELRARYSKMGPREFDRGFRQIAISEEDLLWPADAIEKAKEHNVVLPLALEGQWKAMRRFAGVDLAVADESQELAYSVLLAIGVDEHGHRWVMGIERHRGLSLNAQCLHIVDWHERFAFDAVMVESNAAQKWVVQILTSPADQGGVVRGPKTPVPVKPFHTGAIQKSDLEIGVPSLAAEWEQGIWHIPWGDARSQRLLQPMVDEMTVYPSPGHHTDTVMAAYFAREGFRVLRKPVPKIYAVRI